MMLKMRKINLKLALENLKRISITQQLRLLLELFTAIVFSVLFGLELPYTLALFIIALFLSPYFIRYQLKYQQEEKAFFELTDFCQQFVAAFKQHPKIYAALIECKDVSQNKLLSTLNKWVEGLEKGGYPKIHAQAFIREYPHFIVGNLVHLMLAVEEYGASNTSEGLEIIQDDLEDWIEDTYSFKQTQLATKRRIELLALMALGIAYFSHSMLFKTREIDTLSFYHLTVFLFLVLIIVTLLMAQKALSTAWMDKQEMIWKES